MPERYLTRNVKKETDQHYKGGWPFSADARRHLYLEYAKYPPEIARSRGEEPSRAGTRDMWQEVAKTVMDHVGDGADTIGLDVGSSSGYFIQQLLAAGYKGGIAGVDIETGHQPFLHQEIGLKTPGANVLLGHSDAQKLRNIQLKGDEDEVVNTLKIRPGSVDFLTELFVLYHIPAWENAYNAAHRALKPNGLAIFSGRDRLNQHHLWNLGAIIAQDHKVSAPESFYTHHGLKDIEGYLDSSPKYELLDAVSQAEHIWIPALVEGADEGWRAMKHALASLPYGRDPETGKSIINGAFYDYLDEKIKTEHFEKQAEANNGYFVDYVFQTYFVSRAIK